MIRKLTEQYIDAFHRKDLSAIAPLLADAVALEDPVVKRITGKQAVLDMMAGMFDGCQSLAFRAKNIFIDGNHALIEFTLDIDATHLEGVDVIEWRDGKMHELRAYLDIPKA